MARAVVCISAAVFVEVLGQPRLVSSEEAASSLRQITTHPSEDLTPSLSPDGKWVAFASTRNGNLDIWVRSVRGGRSYQITRHRADDFYPRWNYQGDRIAFVSKRSDAAGDVWIVDVKRYRDHVRAKGKPKRLTKHLGFDAFPSFSPTGRDVAFVSDRTGSRDVWIVSLKSGDLRQFTHGGGTHPAWAPDGRWIAFTSFGESPGQGSNIYVTLVESGEAQRSEAQTTSQIRPSPITTGQELDGFPSWSPDGTEIVFSRFAYDTNLDDRITPDDHCLVIRKSTPPTTLDTQSPTLESLPIQQREFWLTSGAHSDFGPTWASGNVVYFGSDRGGNLDVWSISAEGSIQKAETAPEQYSLAQSRATTGEIFTGSPDPQAETADLYARLLGFRRVIDFFPENRYWCGKADLAIAQTLWGLGQRQVAEDQFRQVLSEYRDQAETCGLAQLALLDISLAEGEIDTNRAVQELHVLLDNYSDQETVAARILIKKGDLQHQTDLITEALTTYGTVQQLYPDDREAAAESQFKIGDCLVDMDRTEEAERAYALIAEEYPDQTAWLDDAMDQILRTADNQSDVLQLLPRYREVITKYRDDIPALAAEAQFRTGRLLSEAGDPEAAQIELRAVETNYPDQTQTVARSRLLLAQTYREIGDWNKAVGLLEQTIADLKGIDDGYNIAQARKELVRTLMDSADRLFEEKYLPAAAARYRHAREIDPGNVEAHRGYIQSKYYAKQIDQAIVEYEQLVTLNAQDEVALYGLGLCYSFKATERAEIYGREGDIDPGFLEKSNATIARALELNYRLLHAYLTMSYNYELMETYESLQEAQGKSWRRKFAETVVAPLVSVFKTITFRKEKEPLLNYEKAIDALTVAVSLNDEKENPALESRLCKNLANNYYNLQEFGYERAYTYYQRALQYDSSFASRREEALVMERMGHSALAAKDFTNGPRYLQRAITLYEDLGRPELVLRNVKRLALLHQLAERYVLAIDYFERAVEAEQRAGNLEEVQRLYRNIAYNYWLLGEPEDAYQNAMRAQRLLESGRLKEVKHQAARIKLGFLGLYVPIPFVDLSRMGAIGSSSAFGFSTDEERALVYTILGSSLAEEKNHDKAIEYFEKKLAIYQERKDRRAEAALLNNIGYLLALTGDYQAAWQHFSKSLDICEEERFVTGVAVNSTNLGQLALLDEADQGAPSKRLPPQTPEEKGSTTPQVDHREIAAARINKALSFLDDQTRPTERHKIHLLNLLGSLTLEVATLNEQFGRLEASVRTTLTDFDNAGYARTYFEEALRLARQSGLGREEILSLLNLSQIYVRIGEWEQAFRGLSACRRLCLREDYPDLLLPTDQHLGDLTARLNDESRQRLQARDPLTYYQEAINGVKALSESRTDRSTPPQERRFHRELYKRAIFYMAEKGDKLGALGTAEEMHIQAFIDAISGEKIKLNSPLQTNTLNWVRTFQEELNQTSSQIRRLESTLDRRDPVLVELRNREDSLRAEYEQALSQLSEEGPQLESLVRVSAVPIEQVQDSLGLGDVVLEYVVGRTSTLLWVVSASRVQMKWIPIEHTRLGQLAADVWRLLSQGNEQAGRSVSVEQLTKILFSQADTTIRSAQRIIVIPDDVLFVLPAQALISAYLDDGDLPTVMCSSLSSYLYSYTQRSIGGTTVFAVSPNLGQPLEELGYEVRGLSPSSDQVPLAEQMLQPLLGTNIIHWQGVSQWNQAFPLQSRLVLENRSGKRLEMRALNLLELKASTSVATLDVMAEGGQTIDADFVPIVERTMNLIGSTSLVLPMCPVPEDQRREFYLTFYDQLYDLPPVGALLETQRQLCLRGNQSQTFAAFQLFGFGGMSALESDRFARRGLTRKIGAGIGAEREGDWADAVRYYEEALAMAELQGDLQSMSQLRNRIIRASARGGFLQKTIQYQKRLVEIAQSEGDTDRLLSRLRNLASLYDKVNDHAAAARIMASYIEIAESHEPGLLAGAHRDLGAIYEKTEEFDLAIKEYTLARDLFEELGEEENVALTLSNMGRVAFRQLDDYHSAIRYLSSALTILEKEDPNRALIDVLHNLGLAYELMAEYRIALDYQNRALEAAQLLDAEEEVGLSWYYLANLYWKTGDYQQAMSHNRKAMEIFDNLGDDELRSLGLATRGLIDLSLGRADEALANENAALALAEDAGHRLNQATILKNRGLIHSANAQPDLALEQLRRAATIDSSIGSKRGLAYDHRNIGSLLLQKSELPAARDELELALELSREIGDGRNQAQCLYYLGLVRGTQGESEQSQLLLEEAAQKANMLFIPDVQWRALRQLGLNLKQTGDREGSRQKYVEALEVIESMRAKIKVEEYQAGFIDDKQEVYGDLIALLIEMGRDEEALFVAERARSRSFLDMLGNRKIDFRSAAGSQALTDLRDIEADLNQVQTEISQLRTKDRAQLTSLERDRLAELDDEINRLRQRYQAQLLALKVSDPELAEMVSVDPWPASRIQTRLPGDAALVEYFVDKDRLFIWLVDTLHVKGWTVRLSKEQLVTQVRQFRDAISRLLSPDELSRELFGHLVKPLYDELQNAESLVIVPHGILHYLPFGCLQDGQGRYLLERFAFSTAPSATVYGICSERGDSYSDRSRRGFSVFALGNPVLPGEPRPLPLARKEVESIGRSFADVEKHLGTSASETLLKRAGTDRDIYLFSCHGEYDPANPLFSALLLAADDENDGRLEAHEIFGLHMDSYIVAMSACETGIGAIAGGDEVIGLSRSFIYAGATSLLASLWKVDDLATAVMVKRFMRYLADGDSRARALQKAQLLVKTEVNSHPAYWAAFQLTGDFR